MIKTLSVSLAFLGLSACGSSSLPPVVRTPLVSHTIKIIPSPHIVQDVATPTPSPTYSPRADGQDPCRRGALGYTIACPIGAPTPSPSPSPVGVN